MGCQGTSVLVLVLLLPFGDLFVLLVSVDSDSFQTTLPASPRGPELIT